MATTLKPVDAVVVGFGWTGAILAKELTEALNGRYRMNAQLSAMLGVLPSYTALGMASLLPHETLAYNDKGDVLVDGKPVAGT